MKIEGLLFGFIAFFLIVASSVYWILSRETAGFTMILLAGGFALLIGYFLSFTARRMEARPEDRADAEISEGTGEIGFFAPHSWWPITVAGSATIAGLGIVFGIWLLVIGLAAVAVTTAGLLFEFYVGINRSQGQTLEALDAMGEKPTSPHKFLGD